jgi:hypothetical protein
MFSVGDKAEQSALAKALDDAGFESHLPQANGIEVADVMSLLNDHSLHGVTMLEPFVLDRCTAWVTRSVVCLDVYQAVEGCQYTVLNIDGRVPDEGSLVEATLAWYAGHKVFPYKTTTISELGGNNNPMIGVISGWAGVSSRPAEVVDAVKAAVAAGAAPPAVTAPPSNVKQLIEVGRVISDIRAKAPLDDATLRAVAGQLAALTPGQMELLEPVADLQQMCREVVLAIIEFSELDRRKNAERRKLFKNEITAIREWVAKPGIRDAIRNNPITC